MNHQPTLIVFVLLTGLWCSLCPAQTTSPTTNPATHPTIVTATAPATVPARQQLVMPPGFKAVEIGGFTVLCEPADETWVRAALAQVKPSTRPTTMPADLLDRVGTHRAALTRQLLADFALADAKAIDALFDSDLLPLLSRYRNAHLPIFYLTCTKDRVAELVRGGWSDPRYTLNRLTNEVVFDPSLRLPVNRPADDTVLPAIYEPADLPAVRQEKLVRVVQRIDADLFNSMSVQSQIQVQRLFAQFIKEQVIAPLKFCPDQEWFGVGLIGTMSSKYTAQVTGWGRATLIQNLLYERRNDPRTPLMSGPIDLLHPLDPAALRPQALPFHIAASGRKASGAVQHLLDRAGDAAVARILDSVRRQMPADGPALVKLIQQITNVDLTAELLPKEPPKSAVDQLLGN